MNLFTTCQRCQHPWTMHGPDGCMHHHAGAICACGIANEPPVDPRSSHRYATTTTTTEREHMGIKGPTGNASGSRIFSSITVLNVKAESTGPCGGDAGHGAKSSLTLTDMAGMGWSVTLTGYDGSVHTVSPESIHIEVYGDDEQGQLLAALNFGRDVLVRSGVEATEPSYDG